MERCEIDAAVAKNTFENLYSPRMVVYNKKTKINTMTRCESKLN